MLASIKSLVLFAIMTYCVSAATVASPRCEKSNTVTIEDCNRALSTYKTYKDGLFIQDRSDTQKSCGECQIHVYSSNGRNLRFSMEGAQAALNLVLNECDNGYGSVTIPESWRYGRNVEPTVLSVEKGSGNHCNSYFGHV